MERMATGSRRRTFDLSRATPTVHQHMTAGTADFCVSWMVGLTATAATRSLVGGATSLAWVLLTAVVAGVWVTSTIVLAGLTGQSLGARVAQTAEVCARSGRPGGVPTMALAFVGGALAREGRLARISLAGR